jgi:hypothetical protein
MLVIKICLFIYLLIASYLLFFQVKVLWKSYRNNGVVRFADEDGKRRFLKRMSIRSISMILLWPLDFIAMPRTYFKAFILLDRVALAETFMNIGKSKI